MATVTGKNFQGQRTETIDEFFDTRWGAYHKRSVKDEPSALWLVYPPCGHQGRLATQMEDKVKHVVTEFKDGSITVEPSIWCKQGGEAGDEPCWHGHLIKGVWKEL